MQSEYISDLGHRYLVLTGEEPADREAFQVQMLLGSYVPSLLECSLQGMNGKDRYFYEITGMKSLKEWSGESPLSFEKLRFILLQVLDLLEEMQEYLMSPSFLVLGTEYIYVQPEENKAYFCFLPGYGQEPQKQFISLTEELIRLSDPKDAECTQLSCNIYAKAMEEDFGPAKLREVISRMRCGSERLQAPMPVRLEKEYRSHTANTVCSPEPVRIREIGNTEKRKKPKHARRLIFCLGLTGILFLLLAGSALEILPRIPAVVSMIFLGGLLVFMLMSEQMGRGSAQAERAWEKEAQKGRYWMVPGNGNSESAFCVEQDLVILGSRPKVCDVVLPERYARPVHARIRIRRDSCYLADLSGAGETCVGEHVLETDEEYRLKDGDPVQIGRLAYRFTVR